jgi:DNA-binding NarL/FixJ family response regulator
MRLLLADDHEVIRRGVRSLLEEHPNWQVCAEASTGREAVELAARLQPDVALVALSLPELNGVEVTRRIRRAAPATEVLIFTWNTAEQLAREAVRAAARGFVLKADAAADLVAAVEAVAQHRFYFSARVAGSLGAGLRQRDHAAEEDLGAVLTGREREIVQLLAEGKSNKEIATALVVSVKTVETHRATIMRKLGINSIVELVHYAIRDHIIQP